MSYMSVFIISAISYVKPGTLQVSGVDGDQNSITLC